MKLLFISQLFDPEYSIKGLEFLSHIKKTGIDIDVITTFPNYPTGKIYSGYKKKLWQIEYSDGIRVIRVYSYISHSRSKISRAMTYLSFMISALIVASIIKKPDVIYAYHPQITTGILAWIIKGVKNTPFITDVQDLWPDALLATNTTNKGLLYRLINKTCDLIYKKSDHIVVLSKGYKKALILRGVPAEKISLIYNWNSGEELLLNEWKEDSVFSNFDKYENKFVYAGNLGAAQSLKSVISAFSKFQDASVCLIIIGSGVEDKLLKNYAKSISAKNVIFLGYIPSNKIKLYLNKSDVLVVHLKDDPLFKITIPSKLQTSLNAGKPILMAVGGEANEVVDYAGAGISAVPENVDSIMSAIDRLLEKRNDWLDMGQSGKHYYEKNMAQHLAVEKITTLLMKVCN